MESSSNVRSVPPRKTLREGQKRVVEAALAKESGLLCVQLPTGYGKTLAAAATFTALRDTGRVNRLLYLVPTSAQLNQFTSDGSDDFLDAGLAGVTPFDVGYSPALALKKHRTNEWIVFAATIQAVAAGGVGIAIKEMLATGRWMIVVDEYHHYGIDKAWGRAVLDLPAGFILAMSATPERKENDSAFGAPAFKVTYRQAVKEGAAKSLSLHAYEYKVDAITVNGEPISFTTSELAESAGSADPVAIDKFITDRKLRWSPKYISPLVSYPIERLWKQRRGFPLQMIVGAMGCLHAKMVCEQIRAMFGDLLTVDWVGTGPYGRSDKENEEVIRRFCPPKRDGARHASDVKLDILVHVGMAGEGLDSVFVTEVVHLNAATITNQNHQENGRAARLIPGASQAIQHAVINVDTSSPFADWRGQKIMDAFDADVTKPPPSDDEETKEENEFSDDDLPDEPLVVIADCELKHIDKGEPEVKQWAEHLVSAADGRIDRSVLDDPNHWLWDAAVRLRREELQQRARGLDLMSTLQQLRETVSKAVGTVALRAVHSSSSGRFEKSLLGDMMKRIYVEMKRRHGSAVDKADETGLRQRYSWLKELERQIKDKGIPLWLL